MATMSSPGTERVTMLQDNILGANGNEGILMESKSMEISPRASRFGTPDQNEPYIPYVDPRLLEDTADPIQSRQRTEKQLHARLVPTTPAYFSRQPRFNESYLRLEALFYKYDRLPRLRNQDMKRVPWMTLADYNEGMGEDISVRLFNQALKWAKDLHRIEPDLKPREVIEAVKPYIRDMNPYEKKKRPGIIDKFGRSVAAGRRKTSTATAFLVEGTGEMFVNGANLAAAFGRVHDRESATWPLRITERVDKYNVWARVSGGGTTGQAEALALAIGKALCVHEPGLKGILRKAGCLTRDPRAVERKKPGHRKARKMPAWVKR